MSKLIKKAGLEIEYTPEMVEELKKCAKDPVYFIQNYCYIQNQELGMIKFKLRKYQVKIVRALHARRFNIMMQPRQSGKTEVTAAYAYWFAIFHGDKNVLIASNKQKAASDIMNRIRFMYENTPDFLRPGAPFYNRGSIEFDNGSKIWSEATTPDTGRGKSVALFILDELAHVRKRIQDDMWASILPTISSGKGLSCVIMSTPNGDTELFAQLWRGANSGTNDFNPLEVKLAEVPGRDDPKWIASMISKFGEQRFRQEFGCEFLSSDPLLIKSMVLNTLKEETPMFNERGFFFWKNIDSNKTYLIGADVSEGVQQDFSTIQVFELDSLEQIGEFRSNTINESQLYDAIKWVINKILSHRDPRTRRQPTVYWSFENNAAGAAIGTLFYNDEKFPEEANLVSGKGEKRPGMRTSGKTKIEACRTLKSLTERTTGGFNFRSKMLIYELKNYISTGASYAAKSGTTDDLVSATLIVCRVIKYLSEYEPGVFEKIYKTEEEFYSETTDPYDEPIPFAMT